MKEKMIQYKWPLMMIGIIILNIVWIIYDKQQMKNGILIEHIPMASASPPVMVEEESVLLMSNESKDKSETIPTNQISINAQSEAETLKVNEDKDEEVPIYICGEVCRAGVYYVKQDAIINDVIKCAGGLTREADATAINLASPIQANEKIIIPRQGEEIDKLEDSYENRERIETLPDSQSNLQSIKAPTSENSTSDNQSTKLININTATKDELMSLSGIGEVKAESIITYRQEQGGFKNIEELMQVSGIGEKTFEKLKLFITT